MNLRKARDYSIGLDIGTGSVGWSVTDQNGELYYFDSKPTWGSRLFQGASTAEETRLKRGQRRRYDRRRQRLDYLQRFFLSSIKEVDPEFFVRMNQSRLWPEDRCPEHSEYRWPLFNGSGLNEPDYYEQFPTIYHLRNYLVNSSEQADIRLIYLAFHHIVKHRGNFLYQDNPKLSAKNADMRVSIERLCEALKNWFEQNEIQCLPKSKDIRSVFEDTSLSSRKKQELIVPFIGLGNEWKKLAIAISKAIVGYKVEFADIFFIEKDESSFSLSNDEKVEAFLAICPDEGVELFEAMQAVYSSYVLMGILKDGNGKTISYCKEQEYNRYKADLKLLKQLIREYVPNEYTRFFRGKTNEGSSKYDATSAEGYTSYNIGTSKMSYDDFIVAINKVFEATSANADKRYQAMSEALDEGIFLKRLRTSDNGAIPYQLHLEEMVAIIDNQAQFYPFLKEEKEKLISLVSFRIPYYVGPLTQKSAAKSADGKTRFAWSIRMPGKEHEKVYPWNWEEVIDRDASAEAFISRMTGTCTYLQGEPVLPRCSLTYEMYCVLNELNGAKLTHGGDKPVRLSTEDRLGIVEDLFKKGRRVSYKAVEEWLQKKHGPSVAKPHISGGQGETGFESKLSSYSDYCKILEVEELADVDTAMAEELILWSTIFEDRSIFRRRVKAKYGDRLNESQIKAVVKKRYVGWGRLSKKLLVGLKTQTDNGPKSIMDILWEGDQNHSEVLGRTMNFMEIIRAEDLGFENLIDEYNSRIIASEGSFALDELRGSPALRRSVNQALRIVGEIISITGEQPRNIFIEVTRDEDEKNKGKRTKRRYDNLKNALEVFKKEDPGLYRELGSLKHGDLDERLTLYFMQRGKSMYSGVDLHIDRLHLYQVDHIVPQSYIKDDSFENKVLVLADENQRKLDSMLLDGAIISKMKPFWQSLLDAKLIGEKKFNNLTRSFFSEKQMKGFINRQLVETSQIVKHIQQILQVQHPETNVLPIKAGLSSQLRKERGLVKCREVNDFHHAHDAYLASQIGRFIQYRHGYVFENPLRLAAVVKKYIEKQGEEFRATRKMPGSSSFIVSSFLSSGFSKETGEIFKDAWDAEAEVDRIRKCFNYPQCFISKMPEETSGTFWDETIYSPKNAKKALSLPLKKGLDPEKYGSYSREQFAYFFAYMARDEKKEQTKAMFAPVPVSVASQIRSSKDALQQYAKKLAEQNGLQFERVLRAKILKYQLIEMDGNRLYITGKREVRNASQIAFSLRETEIMARLSNQEMVSVEEMFSLFKTLARKYMCFAKKLGSQLKIEELEESFKNANGDEQRKVILALVSIANAKTNMIDTSSLGGSKTAGCMKPDISKALSDHQSPVWIVDQSVTGMFERRYKLGL